MVEVQALIIEERPHQFRLLWIVLKKMYGLHFDDVSLIFSITRFV